MTLPATTLASTIGRNATIRYLAASIAASATFQALTGTTTGNAALAYLWQRAAADAVPGFDDTKANVFITHLVRTKQAMAVGDTYDYGFGSGRLDVHFILPIPQAHQGLPDAADAWANEQMDQIEREVLAQSGVAGFLSIDSIEQTNMQMSSRSEERANKLHFAEFFFQIQFGQENR